jgi:hypothetical protein
VASTADALQTTKRSYRRVGWREARTPPAEISRNDGMVGYGATTPNPPYGLLAETARRSVIAPDAAKTPWQIGIADIAAT